MEASISISFNAQRFLAPDAATCQASGDIFTLSTSINLNFPQMPTQASASGAQGNTAMISSSGAAETGGGQTSAPAPLPTPLPAVLAVFQLQLDLSGPAGGVWMNGLSGVGPSSDVATLGHDVGALVAVGATAGEGGGYCDPSATSGILSSLSDLLAASGGAIRSSACLVGPGYGGVATAKLPLCATDGLNGAVALLALALRMPPGSTADWVVSLLAAAAPSALCASSADQLDIRTEIQVRYEICQSDGQLLLATSFTDVKSPY